MQIATSNIIYPIVVSISMSMENNLLNHAAAA